MIDEREFNVIELLGNGVYGCVFKIFDKSKGMNLAMKQVKVGNINDDCNEVEILKRVSQGKGMKNCVGLDTSFAQSDGYRYIIMSYDGRHTLFDYIVQQEPFNIRDCIRDILTGLEYIHTIAKVAHRDLKPSNILVKKTLSPEKRLEFTIADFGCARKLESGISNPNACTRWYRAPELCFGSPRLFTASDIFSVGQIFAHCLLTKPLIPSHNDEDHIVRMLLLLGLPTLSEIQDMELEALDATGPSKHNRIPYAQILYDHLSVLIPRETIPACSWCQNIPFRHMVGHQSFDLIERMLTWSPKHRIKASSALSHSFFQDHDS